jgi:hypothetical protein
MNKKCLKLVYYSSNDWIYISVRSYKLNHRFCWKIDHVCWTLQRFAGTNSRSVAPSLPFREAYVRLCRTCWGCIWPSQAGDRIVSGESSPKLVDFRLVKYRNLLRYKWIYDMDWYGILFTKVLNYGYPLNHWFSHWQPLGVPQSISWKNHDIPSSKLT